MSFVSTMARHKVKVVIAIIASLFLILVAWQFYTVQKAHRTFENYYAFRGCKQLVAKTDTTATCRLASGKVITLVAYKGKWYLNGDLPICWYHNTLCF